MSKKRVYIPEMWKSFADGAKAYVEGYRAKESGVPQKDNPYPEDRSKFGGDVARNAWTSGWRKAQAQS